MPIPDKTVFGPHLTENRPVDFGEVRQLVDDGLKLEYLKKRLERFLVNQINPISDTIPFNSGRSAINVKLFGLMMVSFTKRQSTPLILKRVHAL